MKSTSFLVPIEAAASAVMEVVTEGGTTFYGGFMDKISASNSLEQIHGTLNDAVKRLLAKRDNFQNRLQRHKNKMPTNTYNNWVCRVLKIEEDVKDFESKFEKENKGSQVWHVLSHSEFCQEMKDKWQRVLKLLEESNQLGEYLVDQPPNLDSSVGRVWKAHYNQGGLVGFAVHFREIQFFSNQYFLSGGFRNASLVFTKSLHSPSCKATCLIISYILTYHVVKPSSSKDTFFRCCNMLRPLMGHSSASSLLPRKHSAAQHSNKQSMGISLSSEYLVEVMGAPKIQKFLTFQMHVDNILNLLRNDKVKGIRIHGMVSTEGSKENLSTEQLQRAIVHRLKLDMEITSDTYEVAKRISEDLKGKRYLLLLDDVKQNLNLYGLLGISESTNGSKIVLTTRFGHVCSSIVNRVIKVNCLSQDEA
ncbi:Disease resistance protein [Camellia lanceoleosa]|uniref:Disease resistance protein n=1 Tax=Camellia lanceoleosa TaxID=1840588 RepID=A0ACC0H0K2_9ERIC|nr:Disease resistance protein [Camellia lanceoleosa]